MNFIERQTAWYIGMSHKINSVHGQIVNEHPAFIMKRVKMGFSAENMIDAFRRLAENFRRMSDIISPKLN